MAEGFKLTGGCRCGAVCYTINAPASETVHCHCSICRKLHGALFATFSAIPADAFHVDQGADALAVFESSPGNHRHFCKSGGCQIYVIMPDNPVPYVLTGALDGGAHPSHADDKLRHVFVDSKVPWYELTDDLPKSGEF